MAQKQQFQIDAHPNIYSPNHERKLNITFYEPQQGVNENTGILLWLPGFDMTDDHAHNHSLCEKLADDCNKITVFCEYFGHRFMKGINIPVFHVDTNLLKKVISEEDYEEIVQEGEIKTSRLLEVGQRYNIKIVGQEVLDESDEEFNDMGLMQAMDNLSAVCTVQAILESNEIQYDRTSTIAAGTDHGAYLAYLCNAFAPGLFTMIIESGAGLLPQYLKHPRRLSGRKGKMDYAVDFRYRMNKLPHDEELLHLAKLYKHVKNKANIIAFEIPTDDNKKLVQKRSFCASTKNCMFNEVDDHFVDGTAFQRTSYGIRVHAEELIKYVLGNANVENKQLLDKSSNENFSLKTKMYDYQMSFHQGLPLMERRENKSALK